MNILEILDLIEGVDPNEVRYHKDIGFPEDLVLPRGLSKPYVINLSYGGHAREQAIEEKYGILKLPQRISLANSEIFEVATARGSNVIKKVCVRMPYDKRKDIIIVINVPDGFVRTVWANLNSDTHRTLNRANYATPKPARHLNA